MNKGIEILLARMESNPDEFTTVRGKWDWVMEGVNRRIAGKDKDVLAYLTDEEAQALYDKMQLLARDGFTRNVMETLLREEEEVAQDLMRYAAADMAREFGAKVDTMLLDEWAKAKGVGK